MSDKHKDAQELDQLEWLARNEGGSFGPATVLKLIALARRASQVSAAAPDEVTRLTVELQNQRELTQHWKARANYINGPTDRASEGQAQTSAARFDAKLLVDVATGVIGQWNMLETYDEEMTERFCKQLEREFAAQLADSTAPGAPVAWSYECLQPHTKPGIWCEFLSRDKPCEGPKIRNAQPLYAAPTAQQSLTAGWAVPEPQSETGFKTDYNKGYSLGWNDCRAAFLSAAPLPQVQPSETLEAVEAYDSKDGVDTSHPKYGRGVFFTFNCMETLYRATDQQPVTPSGALGDSNGGVA